VDDGADDAPDDPADVAWLGVGETRDAIRELIFICHLLSSLGSPAETGT
jgi:hypothetical protein